MTDARSNPITLACRCGTTRMTVTGSPIMAVECGCTSCRTAAARLAPPDLLTPQATTPYVMVRKDRIAFDDGVRLSHLRLTPDSATRRVVAACCGTPLFLEFEKGHWLSIYSRLWPAEARPRPTLRTMTRDLPEGVTPPDDMTNARAHTPGFMARLLWAWVAMGFRVPKMPPSVPVDSSGRTAH